MLTVRASCWLEKVDAMKKLLVTLGPASLSPDCIREMSRHGPYVFRLNMSHVSLENLPHHIDLIREHTDVPVCIDSEGAQIRTYRMRGGAVELREGAEVMLLSELAEGIAEAFSLTPVGVAKELCEGDVVRLDWHGASVRVTGSVAAGARAVVERGGRVASCKGVDVNREIRLSAITEKDREAIRIGRKMGVRHYALSFANRPEEVREFRELTGPEARIISKLESLPALRNLSGILTATDEALIDRGDLSRVVPVEKIPFLQMRIIATARALDTPIFVATNLLESMIESGEPTRAEANDVVSTLLMGADGLVLAAESAMGKYPARCVETIRTLMRHCRKWTANSAIDDVLAM